MAFAQLFIFILSSIGFLISFKKNVKLKFIFGFIVLFLIVKFIYEELIPCYFIDKYYCDFASTQYWNFLGIEL